MTAPPMPPRSLRARVGHDDRADAFDEVGARCRAAIDRTLPADWSWEGRRVLDFGCGPGRTLRHLLPEAENCTLLACDVHRESVEWVARHLPVEAFECGAEPPLALEDGTVDLVLAVSVFTHLSESWARWLSELGRVLAADGLLLATVHGAGVWQRSAGARFGLPYDERIGMHVEQPWEDFDSGFGPAVWHGEWWLREHWGRGFEVLSVAAEGFAAAPDGAHRGHGAVLLRRRGAVPSAAELERPADDPRERDAALQSALLARLEGAEQVRAWRGRAVSAEADLARASAELDAVRASTIMRASEPLRRRWYRLKGAAGRSAAR